MHTLRARSLLGLLLTLFLALSACHKKDHAAVTAPPPKADAAWSQHLSEHTAGAVSRHAAITLRFAHDVATTEQLGQSAAAQLSIEPAPTGSPNFVGPREITWKPVEPLKPGQEYRATLKATGLAGVPQDLKPYEFALRALSPDFEVSSASLEADKSAPEKLTLSGKLDTADGEDAASVEKLLVAQLDEASLTLQWTHVEENRAHLFTITGIQRSDKPKLLRVSWDGKPLGLAREGVKELEVPALGVFAVLDSAALTEGRQTLRIRFTDSLDKAQKLDALVSISQGGKTVQVDGSDLLIYPNEHLAGEITVGVKAGLKNARGKKLGKDLEVKLTFPNERPQVRFTGKGTILPAATQLTIPFEAMNARSVRVTAFQIYDNDVGQFLQSNTLAGDSELSRVGRYLWRKTITLPTGQPDRWNRHVIDASDLLRGNPGALFRLSISITRADSTYACPGEVAPAAEAPLANYEDLDLTESSGWDGIEQYYDGEGGNEDWSAREDACNDAYFKYNPGVKTERNFMASNIGLIAKRGADGVLHVAAAAIDSATPMAGVKLDIRNFQNQSIGTAETGSDGLVQVDTKGTPFYLIARKDQEIGYLKLSRGTALANSHFDVGGDAVEAGLKGFIYGERGVWRPGEDIFLTFVLQDQTGKLPKDHPVTIQLFNPANQLVQTLTNKTPMDGFYTFKLKTEEDAPTGLWRANVLAGGRSFSKNLPIETVVPNRLKMDLSFDKPLRADEMPLKGKLDAQWLHGALASGLKADVAVKLLSKPLAFTSFKDFVFEDPTRKFKGEPATIFEGKLDAEGKVSFDANIEAGSDAPAMLEADFTTRVFEDGGAFSTAHSSQPFHPYSRYVGLKLPKGDAIRGMLLTDQKHTVELTALTPDGKATSADAIHVSVHKIDWKWWWEKDGSSNNADFAEGQTSTLISEGDVPVKDGRGQWQFEIKYPDWGRYLVRACDAEGDKGHCTGKIFYADWPGWAGRAEEQTGPGANALYFFADKPNYTVGETATIQLPDAAVGRALLSVETGSKLLEKRWLELTPGKTKFELPITAAMSPNAYVSITLIQPHSRIAATDKTSSGKDNDRPIRLYGIIPVAALDPATVLTPEIKSDEVWRPNGKVSFKVSEKAGREMTYTIAIVDEGLLGLTSFKTPDPHGNFYQREALGVSTWDLYDDVAGAYGAEIERLLSLGGDEGGTNKEAQEQKRFPPVVRVLGPFRLKAKEFATHEIELPQYIGAVRVMVIAGRDKAYGTAEKSVIVREPLSVLATAPRVLGPGEEMRLPVSAFAFEPNVKNVKLTLQADAKTFEIVGDATASLSFDKPGEKNTFFTLKAKPRTGVGRITVLAESGSNKSTTVIDLPVLPRNPLIAVEQQRVLAPGETWSAQFSPVGIATTNSALLSMSAVPPFGLERRLDMLIHYPHGCVEQLTSAAFPQLYLDRLLPLEPKRQNEVQVNVQAAINRLRGYLSPSGGFMYWPGAGENPNYNSWADNYAGHFLAEARARGYHVPAEMWDAWLARQRKAAADGVKGEDAEVRAYRLYTLAIADKPDVGAMNRLAEEPLTSNIARWQLAAAYAQIGLPKVAREVLAKGGGSMQPAKDSPSGAYFRSELRDRAILLDLLARLGDKQAEAEAQKVALDMASEQWLSTQSAAWGLLSLARYYGADKSAGFGYSVAVGKAVAKPQQSTKPMQAMPLNELADGGALSLRNTSDRPLTASVLLRGSPAAGDEVAGAQGLTLDVQYTTLKGVPLNEAKLTQGVDFIAKVTVANKSGGTLGDLALTQVFPSGWQIHNPRFTAGEATPPAMDYQDIRDDRVMSYFGLKDGESRRFEVLLNASFKGRYYLPAVNAEAMYDVRKRAHTAGRWVEVVSP